MPFSSDIVIEKDGTSVIIQNEIKFIQLIFENEVNDGIISLDKETAISLANAILIQANQLNENL